MDLRPGCRQDISGPVPPVRGLQHHSRVLPGPGDRPVQLRRAVRDLRRAETPAVPGHPHQHAAPAVQIHAHDLPAVIRCLHWGLPFLVETDALQLPASAREREAPLLHRIRPFLWPLVGVIAPDVWRGKTHEPEWMAGAVVRSVDEASLSRVGLYRPGGRSRGSQPGTAGARPASYLRLTAGGGP